MQKLKLNVLLAKTDHLAGTFKNFVKDYTNFFKSKQSAFIGERKTYEPKDGTMDEPSKRGTTNVVTTVDEKLDYMVKTNKDYIDAIFSVEATNSNGKAIAQLKVGEVDFGKLTSLELLRLKSLIENGELTQMYAEIPVRDDSKTWKQTTDQAYANRSGIFEGELNKTINKTTVKEHYVLDDPNVKNMKSTEGYKAPIAVKDTLVELGEHTHQKFSGEWSHAQRAELLRRKDVLLAAVIEALKIANEAEAVESTITATKLFDYLHAGK